MEIKYFVIFFLLGFTLCWFLLILIRNNYFVFNNIKLNSSVKIERVPFKDAFHIYSDKYELSLLKVECTGSMGMVLPCDSITIVEKVVSPEQLEVGSIVVYESGLDLIAHRIVNKKENCYEIMCDVCNKFFGESDGCINFNRIKYKIVGVIYA